MIDNSTTIAGVDGGTGTIRITPDCVVFVSDGGRGELALAWRAGHASWNDLLGEVVFDPPYADPVTLADGSRVDLGGSRPAAERWIRTPGPDCPADRFVVSAAEPIR